MRDPYLLYYSLRHGLSWNAPVDGRDIVIPFGRTGLRFVARDLSARGIDEVWMPALICDVVPAAFEGFGIRVKYYPVLDDFSADTDWLSRQGPKAGACPAKAGAFLYVTYFGLTRTAARGAAWARERGLVTIHDNAHGALSTPSAGPACPSDYYITSIGKMLGMRYGAILRVPEASYGTALAARTACVLRIELSNLLSMLPPSAGRLLRPVAAGAPGAGQAAAVLPSNPTSSLAWTFSNHEAVKVRRRRRYGQLMSLHNVEASGPLALDAGDVPWIFPLVSAREPDPAAGEFRWPFLPAEVLGSSGKWPRWYREILALPVW